MFAERGAAGAEYSLPFPFAALRARLANRTDAAPRELLVPLGRSLQRNAANPDFFVYPRVLLALDRRAAAREPEADTAGRFTDRLFLGYQEGAAIIEVISYNEDAGRFEFQVVRDYRAGATPDVRYAKRADCVPCHQNHAPLFSRPLWDETNANADVAALLAATGREFYGVPRDPGIDEAQAFDAATDRANLLAVWQRLWSDGCGDGAAGTHCRADALDAALRYRLAGGRSAPPARAGEMTKLESALRANWRAVRWPRGLALPNPDVPNPQAAALRDAARTTRSRRARSARRPARSASRRSPSCRRTSSPSGRDPRSRFGRPTVSTRRSSNASSPGSRSGSPVRRYARSIDTWPPEAAAARRSRCLAAAPRSRARAVARPHIVSRAVHATAASRRTSRSTWIETTQQPTAAALLRLEIGGAADSLRGIAGTVEPHSGPGRSRLTSATRQQVCARAPRPAP